MVNFLKKHFLPIILLSLCLLFVSASYVRFVILNDYLVSYEVDCNPEYQSCFIGCEDDDCEAPYLYHIIEKHAHDLKASCGNSIADCIGAQTCQVTDMHCSEIFCDPLTGGECSGRNPQNPVSKL